jgi:Uma2 family endonuclease
VVFAIAAVKQRERIPRDKSGQVANRFEIYPDWAIEILSPDQRQNQILANLLHCVDHGTELGSGQPHTFLNKKRQIS